MKQLKVLFSILLMFGCQSPKNEVYLENQFDIAIGLNDMETAIHYLFELKALDPNNNSVDIRLTDLYYKTNNYRGVVEAATNAYEKANNLEKKQLLLTKVKAQKAINDIEETIKSLESLSVIDTYNKLDYKYEIAVLYFEQKDLEKALESMQVVLDDTTASKVIKTLTSEIGNEKVSYELAALNFIGYIQIIKEDFSNAEKTFAKIKEITKTFKLANNNYDLLQQRKQHQ